ILAPSELAVAVPAPLVRAVGERVSLDLAREGLDGLLVLARPAETAAEVEEPALDPGGGAARLLQQLEGCGVSALVEGSHAVRVQARGRGRRRRGRCPAG